MKKWYLGLLIACIAMLTLYCDLMSEKMIELKHYPLDDLKGLSAETVAEYLNNVSSNGKIEFDNKVSSDGKGSVKIIINNSTKINLIETGKIDIENARLIYQAKVKTKEIDGQVYLEMLCVVKGQSYFSRGLKKILTGTVDWTTLETPFIFKKGETPDNVKLGIVINATGTVWVDDIRILKGPLE